MAFTILPSGGVPAPTPAPRQGMLSEPMRPAQRGILSMPQGGVMQKLFNADMLPAWLAMATGGNQQQQMQGFAQGMTSAQGAIRERTEIDRQMAEQRARDAKAMAYIRTQAPQYAGAVEAGVLDPADAYRAASQRPEPVKGTEIGGRLVNPFTGEVMADFSESAGNAKRSLSPVYLQNPDGTVTVGQLTDSGQLAPSEMPEGYQVLSPYEKSLQTAQGRAQGEYTGESIAGASGARTTALDSIQVIDGLLASPGLDSIIGNVQGRLPAGIPFLTGGQQGADAAARLYQIQGKAFLEAFESLKGAGQITEIEGTKATQAIARLDTAQSEAEFRASLLELRGILERGAARAEALGGGSTRTSTRPTGTTSSGVSWGIE